MESLAAKYRPRTFDDLVGQKQVQVILRQMVQKRRVPHALVFDGSRGTGKTTTLRILAAALNCEGSPVPCGQCVSCKSVFHGTSPDLHEIDAASNGLVDDIRKLRQQVLYATGGEWHVIGLDEAHGMSKAGFDALLKPIEEPAPNTVFVLLTTEPRKIPDTIMSRCMPFTFGRIPVADMIGRLEHICAAEALDVEPGLLALIAERADGGMRDAIMALDQVTRAGHTTVAAFNELIGDTDYAPALLAALVAGDLAAAFAGLHAQLVRTGDPAGVTSKLVAVLRDVLVLRCGGALAVQGDRLTARQALADAVTPAQATAAMKILWELKVKVRADEARTILDLAVVMISEVFAGSRPAAPTPPPRKLTIDEIRRMR